MKQTPVKMSSKAQKSRSEKEYRFPTSSPRGEEEEAAIKASGGHPKPPKENVGVD